MFVINKSVVYYILALFLVFNLFGCRIVKEIDVANKDDLKKYVDSNKWSVLYPSSWDKIEENFIQETSSGQTINFNSEIISKSDLLYWINCEIERKLRTEEAQNSVFEHVSTYFKNDLEVYEYTIQSDMDGVTYLLKTTIFYDGHMKYEFNGALPLIDGEIYEAIINSFTIEK